MNIQPGQYQLRRRRTKTNIALIRNYVIVVLLFGVLVFRFTPPSNDIYAISTAKISEPIPSSSSSSSSSSSTTTTKTTVVLCDVSTPHSKNKETTAAVAKGRFRIVIRNDDIRRKGSSAEAFLKLVDDQFYDGTYTFRVIKGFIVQWGIRSDNEKKSTPAKKRIRESDTDPNYTSSSNLKRLSNVRGTITMIAGPTGQVFVNTGDNSKLDKEGTIPFGVLEDEESMPLADSIYGYKGGQGQIPAIKTGEIPTEFPEMSRIDRCYRAIISGSNELLLR